MGDKLDCKSDFVDKELIKSIEKEVEERFNRLLDYDELTGLYSKKKFFEETQKYLRANKDEKFMFVRFDVDRFQFINQVYGRAEGDKLLIYIAEKLRTIDTLYKEAIYGRIDADIFCACIPYNKRMAMRVLRNARRNLERYTDLYDIVPTFGVYIIEDNEMNIEDIYDRAALAAKVAKGSYENCYAFYSRTMHERMLQEQYITNEMKHALLDHHFQVYYQPKFDLKSGRPYGAEALVRWKHPKDGMISPATFIPIFEKNGFITRLDYYMWTNVCRDIREWLDKGYDVKPISVNVSRVTLFDEKFEEKLLSVLDKYKIPRELFNIELTESAYSETPKLMGRLVKRLRDQGFVVMMDDFGAGYSSLNVLKDIEIDVLKIDLSFFERTDKVCRAKGIITSVIKMARTLNIPVVAEGVELEEQVSFLSEAGCEYIQGYYFAIPMPSNLYEKILMAQNS